MLKFFRTLGVNLVCSVSCVVLTGVCGVVQAQTAVKYLHDWQWEGPAAPVLMANKGAFQKENLQVGLQSGTGSAATVGKVAAGEADIGLGDFSALVEWASKNPNVPSPVAVYVLYERVPAALFVRKSSGVQKLQDMAGKKVMAPPFDGGRKLWPVFSQYANTGEVKWESIDASKREEAFAKGQTDAITGFYFTTMLNIERQGMSGSEYNVFAFHDSGIRLYGNVLMVNPKFLSDNPRAVAGFVRAYHSGLKASIKDAKEAARAVKEINPKADEGHEWRRWRLASDTFVMTPTVREQGLGTLDMGRAQSGIDLVAQALKLPSKPALKAIATTDFLPPLKDRWLN
jgi:NitT/TauT family transport system substrate-binding protein